jgi:PAS domain S-box-containing protein
MAGRRASAGRGRADAAAGKLNAALRFIGNPLPMWVYDLETLRILDVNDAALALYGYDRGEFVGRRVTELRAVEHAGDETVCIAAPDAALPVSVTRRHRRKDGTAIDVHILSHLLAFDRRPAVLAVAQDVTDRR